MNLKPLHDRVIVKPIETETKSAGGIIIPDNNVERPLEGTVVAVGPGSLTYENKFIETTVKPDSRVLYHRGAGQEVKIDGQTYLIMRESDILGELSIEGFVSRKTLVDALVSMHRAFDVDQNATDTSAIGKCRLVLKELGLL